MFVMDYYGHKLSNGVLFAHHLILDAPGGSSHLGYRRRVPFWHNPTMRVKHRLRSRDGHVQINTQGWAENISRSTEYEVYTVYYKR